jgi:hypothetical protein
MYKKEQSCGVVTVNVFLDCKVKAQSWVSGGTPTIRPSRLRHLQFSSAPLKPNSPNGFGFFGPSATRIGFKLGRTARPQNANEDPMTQTVMDRTAEHIAESAQQASRATNAVADAIGNGLGAVRRAAKQGGDAAEEFLNDTTQRIQRHSVLTVAATFAVGLTVGAMLGWMMKRE